MALTEEQRAVVATHTPVLQVHAFAGTGKTATLAAFAQARPAQRFLYVAFNKAVQQEATRRFPANVVARTCHALAFQAVGRAYQHKLVNSLKPPDILAPLGLESQPLAEAYPLAQAVLDVLQQFLTSADPELDRRHVPALYQEVYGARLVQRARRLWQEMCDPNQPLGMVHDGYLKLYQLSQPTLAGVDGILFDESHDADAAMLDIVRRQPVPQVYVGDRHQQIYSWRGTCNALEAVHPSALRYLTRSFRFGARIATLANQLLAQYKGETVPVQGGRGEGRLGEVDRRRPYTLIARTNAGVFEAAAEQVRRRHPPRLGFVGGVGSYPFERILDAWRLSSGQRQAMRDAWLRTFPDFPTLEQLAYELDDAELKQLCRVVRQYGQQIPALVRHIRQSAVADWTAAEVCLTTAHKAKGLEFDQVRLAEDFPSLRHTPLAELNLEEVSLLYVAITRTVEVLEINTSVRELIDAWSRASDGTVKLMG